MTWYGWIWTRGRWQRVCRGASPAECARELERLHPGLRNMAYGITGGAVPDWTPGQLEWEV